MKCRSKSSDCICKGLKKEFPTCDDCGAFHAFCECEVTVKCWRCMNGKLMFPEGFLHCWHCGATGFITKRKYGIDI